MGGGAVGEAKRQASAHPGCEAPVDRGSTNGSYERGHSRWDGGGDIRCHGALGPIAFDELMNLFSTQHFKVVHSHRMPSRHRPPTSVQRGVAAQPPAGLLCYPARLTVGHGHTGAEAFSRRINEHDVSALSTTPEGFHIDYLGRAPTS